MSSCMRMRRRHDPVERIVDWKCQRAPLEGCPLACSGEERTEKSVAPLERGRGLFGVQYCSRSILEGMKSPKNGSARLGGTRFEGARSQNRDLDPTNEVPVRANPEPGALMDR